MIAFCDYYTWEGELEGGEFIYIVDGKIVETANSFSELKDKIEPPAE